ncbi:MAG: MFS transporter [Thermoleophilia bacterium]
MVAQGSFAALLLGLAAIAEQIRDELGLSLAAVGAILAAPTFGSIATVLAWGALADRIGERAVVATGLGVAAAAMAVTAFADSALALGAGLAVAGVFGVSANAASGRAVVSWFRRDERGMALGLRHMSTPLGGAAAAALLPVAADGGGLEAAFLALAAALATGSLAAFLGFRRPPPDVAGDVAVAAVPRPGALRDPGIWTVSLGSATVVLAQISLLSFIALYLHEERGWSVTAAALALAAVQLGGAVARVAAGVWSDRSGSRLRPLRLIALWTAVALAVATLLLGGPDALAAAGLAVAAVLSMAGNGVSFAAVAEMTGPDRVGTALGLQNTVLAVAVAVASPLFGALAGLLSWTTAFAITSVYPLVGWWLLRRLEARRRLEATAA